VFFLFPHLGTTSTAAERFLAAEGHLDQFGPAALEDIARLIEDLILAINSL
jgi:hypothetical protein